MTYCGHVPADGLVFASDSRTNAGVDHIATFKSCTFSIRRGTGAGAAIRRQSGHHQSVISLLSARIRTQQEPNLMQVTSSTTPRC